jgi:hypothetical protein
VVGMIYQVLSISGRSWRTSLEADLKNDDVGRTWTCGRDGKRSWELVLLRV